MPPSLFSILFSSLSFLLAHMCMHTCIDGRELPSPYVVTISSSFSSLCHHLMQNLSLPLSAPFLPPSTLSFLSCPCACLRGWRKKILSSQKNFLLSSFSLLLLSSPYPFFLCSSSILFLSISLFFNSYLTLSREHRGKKFSCLVREVLSPFFLSISCSSFLLSSLAFLPLHSLHCLSPSLFLSHSLFLLFSWLCTEKNFSCKGEKLLCRFFSFLCAISLFPLTFTYTLLSSLCTSLSCVRIASFSSCMCRQKRRGERGERKRTFNKFLFSLTTTQFYCDVGGYETAQKLKRLTRRDKANCN